MTRQIITVVGGTGAQGGGVVDALLASGQFAVRVVSRNPASKSAEALEKRGVQVVKGDLLEPSSLRAAFEGAYGAFLVTNFWDPAQMQKETEIGRRSGEGGARCRCSALHLVDASRCRKADRRAAQAPALHG